MSNQHVHAQCGRLSGTALSGLSIRDLTILYDAVKGCRNALLAVCNQPRCSDGDGAAADILQERADDLAFELEAVVAELAKRDSDSELDRHARARTLLAFHLDTGDDLEALAAGLRV